MTEEGHQTAIVDAVGGKVSLITVIAFTVVASAAIGLRLLAKRYTKTKWAADDSWAICSLVGVFAWTGVEIWGLYKGKQNIKSQTYLKTMYAASPIYAYISITAKLSVLFLYRRLFPVEPFRRITATMAIIWAILGITATIVVLIPCRPVRKYWQPETPGSCYKIAEVTLTLSSVDIIMDAVTLALPVKVIVGLQLSARKKGMLYFIFLLGGFVVVTGIVRLVLLFKDHHIDSDGKMFSQNQGQIWSNVHVGTAILCASLPTFPPLLSHFLAFCNKTALRLSSLFVDLCTFRETDSQESWDDNNSNPHHQLNNSAGDKRLFMEAAAIESGSWSTESGTEMSGIVVRDIINVE